MQALRLYSFIWFIWIIISWLTAFGAIHLDYYNPIVNFFYRITDGVIDKIFGYTSNGDTSSNHYAL